MLGDVREPDRVGALGGEVPLHQIVVNGGAGLLPAALATRLRRRRPQLLVPTQAPHPALAELVAGGLELVGEEPVAELRIIAVEIDEGVREAGVVEIAVRARVGAPLVERLGREAEHPAGQPHRDPLGGQVEDQRVAHFGRASLAK